MKKNNLVEIKKMDLILLQERVKKLEKELVDLSLDKIKGGNIREAKNKRRDLAQMLTILKQKELLKQLGELNNE